MLPILRESTEGAGSALHSAGWREASRVPPEILALFPYEEHPYNLALVLEVARVCGIEPLFALKSMAENVVPDIGVLKTYAPVVGTHGRSLAFSNGCSANERHGCTGNWTRLGFDAHDPDGEPGLWVSAFVNNRADRTARSQVFSRVMVSDIAVDRHFLVGSNLTGLMGFYGEAVEEYVALVDLWQPIDADAGDAATALSLAPSRTNDVLGAARARLDKHFRHARLATSGANVRAELGVMLLAIGLPESASSPLLEAWSVPEEIAKALATRGLLATVVEGVVGPLRARVEQWKAHNEFLGALPRVGAGIGGATGADAVGLNERLREFLRKAFHAKIVVLDESVQGDGDALVEALLRHVPPGFHERLMGVQNIKGPGLTLIYRLEVATEAARQLRALAMGGLRFQVHQALTRLAALPDVPLFARASLQAELDHIVSHFRSFDAEESTLLDIFRSRLGDADAAKRAGDALEPALRRGLGRRAYEASGFEAAGSILREFFEPLAAIARRVKSDRVYRGLADGRLSPERAARALRVLIDGA